MRGTVPGDAAPTAVPGVSPTAPGVPGAVPDPEAATYLAAAAEAAMAAALPGPAVGGSNTGNFEC